MPTDARGVAGALDTAHRLPHRAHVPAVQAEFGDVQHRLVAELKDLHPGAGVGRGARLADAHHRGGPGVLPAHRQPLVDHRRPSLRVAQRITAGQADPGDHPVGDRGLAAVREQHGLVAAGGEVAQRVSLAVVGKEPADLLLVRGTQGGGEPLRAQQQEQRGEQGGRAE